MKPMLAKKYNPSRITYPCYVQRKLDGIRAIALPDEPTLQSRPKPPDFKTIFWHPGVLPHIGEEFPSVRSHFPDLVFDGELYCHGKSLQQINSRVAVKRTTPHRDVRSISYIIFDVFDPTMPTLRADARASLLHTLISALGPLGLSHIKVMPYVHCPDATYGDRYYSQMLASGYEGIMYRNASAPYATSLTCKNKENRVFDLQKRKETLDIDCTVVGLVESEKRPGHLKGFQVQDTTGAVFFVGSGYTIPERKDYWDLGPSCLGASVKVIFRLRSDSGTPLEPRAVSVELP